MIEDGSSLLSALNHRSDDLIFQLFDQSSAIIIILTEDGKLLALNKQAALTLKCNAIDLMNTDYYSSLPHLLLSAEKIQKLISEQTTLQTECKIEGEILCFTWKAALLQSNTNSEGLIILQGENITELKLLKKNLLYMEKIINILPGVMWWKDLEGRYLGCNQAMLKVCSLETKEEIIGKTDYDMPWTKEESDHYRADDKSVMDTKQAKLNIEESQTFPDGRVTTLLTNKVPVFDENNTIMGTLGTFLDITERKQKEMEVLLTNQQLHIALEKLKQASDSESKLKNELVSAARMAGMAEVSTSVLHNVGNVLNSVNTSLFMVNKLFHQIPFSKLIKISRLMQENMPEIGHYLTEDKQGKLIIAYLQTLTESAVNDSETISQELNLLHSHLEHIVEIISTQQSMIISHGFNEDVVIADLVTNAITINIGVNNRAGITLNTQFNETPPLRTDRVKLMQILVNIIKNSIEALTSSDNTEKSLTLSTHDRDGRNLCIKVSDSGIGISEENLKQIFKHGFTTKEKGHGFGLHNCILYAKEMGGTIEVESAGLNKGTTFNIILPYHPPESD